MEDGDDEDERAKFKILSLAFPQSFLNLYFHHFRMFRLEFGELSFFGISWRQIIKPVANFIYICPYGLEMAMGKKNTLLYLDEKVVMAAKRFGLNLSEVAEVALREKLSPLMSAGARQLEFDKHLEDLREDGVCFELPFELDGIEIRNVGPIDEFKEKFKPGINVVLGSNGSGKSMMFGAIALAFGQQMKWTRRWPPAINVGAYRAQFFLKHGKKAGGVKIHMHKTPTAELKFSTGRTVRSVKCTLLDEPLNLAQDEHKRKFLEWLRRRGGQVILFTFDESFVIPSAHVIRLQGAAE